MQKIRQDINIGPHLRKLRKLNHLTQEHTVAKMQLMGCSISRESYAKIESGIANIRISELVALCVIFQTDFNAIFPDIKTLQESVSA